MKAIALALLLVLDVDPDSLQLEYARRAAIHAGKIPPVASWATVSTLPNREQAAPRPLSFTGTIPTNGSTRCADDTTHLGGSWYHISVLFQQKYPWAPPWKYGPRYVTASNDSPVGRSVTIAVPDTFPYGTLVFRVVRARAGAPDPDSSSCDSKTYLPSRAQ